MSTATNRVSGLPVSNVTRDRESLIKHYFFSNFSYSEIIYFLSLHGITISKRHLHRMLRYYNLSRRTNKSPINRVIESIYNELSSGPNSNFRYRYMHQKLRSKGLVVSRETVRVIIKSLDPAGVERRSGRKLQRRVYRCPGPNFTWHIDGYDKLKPFGFCIHGCVDGFSRKIIWLFVGSTNNDPLIITSYYLKLVKENRVVPRLVRADRGSENSVLGGIQRSFRRNHEDSLAGNISLIFNHL